jgi:hypothetical protein
VEREAMNCIDTKTPAGCDQQGRYETRDWGRPGAGLQLAMMNRDSDADWQRDALEAMNKAQCGPLLNQANSLAHDEASWLRASRSVGPVVTPCKPLPLLTRWGMRLSQWFNRKV